MSPYTLYLVVNTATGEFLGHKGRFQSVPRYWNKRHHAVSAIKCANYRWRYWSPDDQRVANLMVVEVRAVEEQRWPVAELVKK